MVGSGVKSVLERVGVERFKIQQEEDEVKGDGGEEEVNITRG